ncbi:hypothetical protein OAJ57_02070 [Alphaproteobacteria bacterium]|nr:hypothetical protein [Alphaproteobacteria bacterium]
MIQIWLIVGIGIVAVAAVLFLLSSEKPDALASKGNQLYLTYLLILLLFVGSGHEHYMG